ncbi:zinc finger BED domain-containing protein RICESLEEPER 1-like [Phragmites australis]|uniref:zinc finger BED domain-containing protein RICESLEEPER 1-like n=1 Tax=Phragmites australis TaxID=29695 RepID=UPI002D78D68D|nr:zinc finger BED domain-containing protein RICESLEEPER 1-like [Phragmites australis]
MAEASTQRRKRKLEPRSGVWEHFNRFTDDHGNDKAECKSCRLVLSANSKNGTSSLQSHVRICKCKGQEAAAVGGRPPRPSAPSHSDPSSHRDAAGLEEEEEASKYLARMIALHGYDSSVVEDDYFRSFVRRLNPEFRVPSRSAIEEICDGIFDKARTDLFYRLRCSHGRVSLAVGRTETMEGQVLYTACHFIDDEWNLHKVAMDAYVDVQWSGFYGPFSGMPELCLNSDQFLYFTSIDHVLDGISGRGILDRLFMMARGKMDGIIHPQLMDYIEEKIPNAYPRRRELISTTYMDEVLHSIARRLTLRPDFDLEMCLESGVQDLHVTRQKRQQLLSQLGLDYLWIYGEHWYACYCSLEVLRKEGSSAIAGIDSEFVGLLCNIWGKIYRAIKRISASICPTSNLCLAELFNVREVLQSGLERTARDNANVFINGRCLSFIGGKDVADVLKDAMDTLDRSLKDSYLVWSIPLVLDPRYKLGYIEFALRRAFGPNEAARYISEVTGQIKKLYADYIEYDGGINGADSSLVFAAEAVDSAAPLEQAWDEHFRSQDGVAEVTSCLDAKTELDRYLDDRLVPPTTEGFDILGWWKVYSSTYPAVARMAMDSLAMPTCSKLSSKQIAHVRSIFRGYSKEEYRHSMPKCN